MASRRAIACWSGPPSTFRRPSAAAVNSTRFAIRTALLGQQGVPVFCSTGGRTKWNRHRYGIAKTHALDAVCVGVVGGVRGWGGPTLTVRATGRGSHQRAKTDRFGFPKGDPKSRIKRHFGFATGDLVRAMVPNGRHVGLHFGRVAVRKTGWFLVGTRDGINHRYCTLLQRGDGYTYAVDVTR